MAVTKESFGFTKDGTEVFRYTLTNDAGTQLVLSNFGALLTELHVADKDGVFKDIVLGADNVTPYENNKCCFGATVGRSANRIGNATFELNGVKYDLPVNDNENNLHSGPDLYYIRVWETKEYGKDKKGDSFVTFSLHSPHMDQGYPGNLDVDVTYTLTKVNEVKIHYLAKADQDTIINMTNHSYFNLAGHDAGDVTGQLVHLDADHYTKATKHSIPTGELLAVKGTPMDFTKERAMSEDIDKDYQPLNWAGGYDHNYALNGYASAKGKLFFAGSLFDPKSGRFMEIFTDLPGIQLYSGNYIKGRFAGKGGAKYVRRGGVCFETQFFPNAINCPEFVSPVTKAGKTYETTTIYKFSVKA